MVQNYKHYFTISSIDNILKPFILYSMQSCILNVLMVEVTKGFGELYGVFFTKWWVHDTCTVNFFEKNVFYKNVVNYRISYQEKIILYKKKKSSPVYLLG